jgi:GNAT superfamily N-acetyltransferase
LSASTAGPPLTRLDYIPLAADGSDIDDIAALLRAVFPKAFWLTPRYLRWLYLGNPEGSAVGFNAHDESGRLVGHYAVVPMRAVFRAGGEPIHGALSLNSAVSEAARGRGLFVRLAELTYERTREAGGRFILGVGNANSTHGLVKSLGFTYYGPLDAKVGIGNPEPAAARSVSGFARHWDERSLAWRLDNPEAPSFVHDRVLFRSYRGLNVVLKWDNALALPASVRRKRPLAPLVYVGRRPDLRFPRLRFVDIPHRLRPSPLNLTIKPLDETLPRLTDDVLLDALDFDAF